MTSETGSGQIIDTDGASHCFDKTRYKHSWCDKAGNYCLEFDDGDYYTVSAEEYIRVVIQ